ncbi:MAG: hypothetical protein K6L73_09300 [Cellvibrionaceae bacterium]
MVDKDIQELTGKALNGGYRCLSDDELIRLKDYYIRLLRSPNQPPIAQPLFKRELKRIDQAICLG